MLGRLIVNVKQIGLANLLLKETMYPEYIQDAATEEALCGELSECLNNSNRIDCTLDQASRLKKALAQPAGLTAADWLKHHIEADS